MQALMTSQTPAAVPTIKLLAEDRFLQRVADIHGLIARKAFELFAARGFTHGHDLDDWLLAESQILLPVCLELSESSTTLIVRTALPDFSEKEIKIYAEPRQVFVTCERPSHRVFRGLHLPAEIDVEKITATLRNGQLEITMPKVDAGRKAAAAGKAA